MPRLPVLVANTNPSGPSRELRIRRHIRRPHPNKMITDQIRSNVYPRAPAPNGNCGSHLTVRSWVSLDGFGSVDG
jgi:hypothetical protein